jgi:hypothetical protein
LSGASNVSGCDNTFLGTLTCTDNIGIYGNSTAIGSGATITASNQIVLGRASENVVVKGSANIAGKQPFWEICLSVNQRMLTH